ncbi:MAG: hypothetical protein A3205_05765 [Methanomassiliicoccales archaeon Mx-03]|nr:MAG: hypothetical protein A3205_05765 [Methanomassiliicoccales archaeon Mx-03]
MPTLNWIGKDRIVNHDKDVPFCVLDKQYEYDQSGCRLERESWQSNSDAPENLIIHGDNLYALKALLPRFEGKVDCIYIDPPYNTGNEGWVYNDNVNDPRMRRWLGEVVGSANDDLSRDDKWLCMMYPRLVLLSRLLSPTGSIFISIDDNEVSNLRAICDEIFQASRFVAQITVLCNPKGRSQDKYFATNHEYILVYSKKILPKGSFLVEKSDDKISKEYTLEDEKGLYRTHNLRNTHREYHRYNRQNLWYPFYVDDNDGSISMYRDDRHTVEVYPLWPDGFEGCWTWGKEKAVSDFDYLCAKKVDGVWTINRKDYAYADGTSQAKLFTIWNDPSFFTERGQRTFGEIFEGTSKEDFPQPKSVDLVKEVLRCATDKDSLVLDSFAGSGTTAHAVLNLNAEDGGNRRFILIETMDYAETITAERVKRVIRGYKKLPEKVEEALYSKKITTTDLKKGLELYQEAYDLYESVDQSQYLSVSKPKIKSGYLVVAATREIEAGSTNAVPGSFSYYELGEPLFDEDGLLKKGVELQTLREYVWFMETRTPYAPTGSDIPYHMGRAFSTSYWLYYDPERKMMLDRDFFDSIDDGSESFVIYADACLLQSSLMKARNINFKKIPREIPKM